ncbi:MAG: polysaccharide biosynthesis/export family protein, partial [Mariprofundales bacterium]
MVLLLLASAISVSPAAAESLQLTADQLKAAQQFSNSSKSSMSGSGGVNPDLADQRRSARLASKPLARDVSLRPSALELTYCKGMDNTAGLGSSPFKVLHEWKKNSLIPQVLNLAQIPHQHGMQPQVPPSQYGMQPQVPPSQYGISSEVVDQCDNAHRLQQFGYELFAGSPITFAPANDIPVPAEYIIGPGDELKVQLFGRRDDHLSLLVDRDGEVAFPGVGALNVTGMRYAEVRAFIAAQIKEKIIGVSVSITMGKLRSIRVFVLGEVEVPGSYAVSGLSTISNALFYSGGAKKTGSLRKIQLKRQGKVIARIDLYDFLLHGNTAGDQRLLPGDVVFIPP